jgi:hypothetical protein
MIYWQYTDTCYSTLFRVSVLSLSVTLYTIAHTKHETCIHSDPLILGPLRQHSSCLWPKLNFPGIWILTHPLTYETLQWCPWINICCSVFHGNIITCLCNGRVSSDRVPKFCLCNRWVKWWVNPFRTDARMHVGACQQRPGIIHCMPSDVHVRYFSPCKPLNVVPVPCDFLQAGYHTRMLHIFHNAPISTHPAR